MSTTKQDMGNGETTVAGIVAGQDGTRRTIPAAERVYPVRRTDGAVVLCSVPR